MTEPTPEPDATPDAAPETSPDAPPAAPAPAPAPAAREPAAPWKRYAGILGVVVLALGVLWLVFGERVRMGLHISGLHSNDGRTRAAHVKALKEHPNKDLVIDLLSDAVSDSSNSFETRRMCADLLVRHFNRLSVLETKLRDAGDVMTRGVILRSLMVQPYFDDQIATDPSFRVHDTIDAWLKRENDVTRSNAIQLAVRTDHKEAMPLIRPLIARSGAPMVHKTQERDVMIAAAGAAEHFADCETLPKLMEIGKDDPDLLVRLRFMQILDRSVFRAAPPPVCAGVVDPDAFAAYVRAALDDPAHEVRMGAMLILARKPAWTEPSLPRLREIVAGPKMKDGRDTGAERRHALEALLRAGKKEDLDRIPSACHDPSMEVRSTAARSIKALKDTGYEGCWIGLLEDETESLVLWEDVLDLFYKWAKIGTGRLGFPPSMSLKAVQKPGEWKKDLANIFAGQEVVVAESDGTFMRISRASIARDHFRWYARKLGIEGEALEQATAAREAFYAAKRKGDAAAAQAALEGAPRAADLWSYEDAWLALNG